MNDAYVLMQAFPYEGATVLGVFASFTKAETQLYKVFHEYTQSHPSRLCHKLVMDQEGSDEQRTFAKLVERGTIRDYKHVPSVYEMVIVDKDEEPHLYLTIKRFPVV